MRTQKNSRNFALGNQRQALAFMKSRLTPLFYQKMLKRARCFTRCTRKSEMIKRQKDKEVHTSDSIQNDDLGKKEIV